MIKKIIDKHLGKMAEEMLKLNDKDIQRFIKETQKEGADYKAQVDFMKIILSQVLIFPEEEQPNALVDQMKQFVSALKMHSDSYQFQVELNDGVIHSTREFCLPGFMMVSDLAYAVMAAYRADGSHMFSITYKKDCFMLGDEDWESIPADKVPIGALELRKGNVLKMVYDFGENWEFTIRYKGKKKVDFEMNVPELLSGEGYNIWEDNRYDLRKLIEDPQQMGTMYDGEEISVGECAEEENITVLQKDQKDLFMDEILELKMMYEHLEEPDFEDVFDTGYQA